MSSVLKICTNTFSQRLDSIEILQKYSRALLQRWAAQFPSKEGPCPLAVLIYFCSHLIIPPYTFSWITQVSFAPSVGFFSYPLFLQSERHSGFLFEVQILCQFPTQNTVFLKIDNKFLNVILCELLCVSCYCSSPPQNKKKTQHVIFRASIPE